MDEIANWEKKAILGKYLRDIYKLEDELSSLIRKIDKITTLEHFGGSTESMRKEKYKMIDKKLKKIKELENLKKEYQETRNKFLGR